jgi:carbonic anhydrase
VRGHGPTIHGWIYAINDGLLRDLDICVSGQDEVEEVYARAVSRGI